MSTPRRTEESGYSHTPTSDSSTPDTRRGPGALKVMNHSFASSDDDEQGGKMEGQQEEEVHEDWAGDALRRMNLQ